MNLTIFVEGGGDHASDLRTVCRKGYSALLRKAGLSGHMPRVSVSGGRSQAYCDFCNALTPSLLLVDSEDAVVPESSPWEHVL